MLLKQPRMNDYRNASTVLQWTIHCGWKKRYDPRRCILSHPITSFQSSKDIGTLSWWSAKRHHLPQDPRQQLQEQRKISLSQLEFLSLSLSLFLPLSRMERLIPTPNPTQKYVQPKMLRTCLERVLPIAFSIIFPSCLRSVHRWWSHLHGAARRGRSWTKMRTER